MRLEGGNGPDRSRPPFSVRNPDLVVPERSQFSLDFLDFVPLQRLLGIMLGRLCELPRPPDIGITQPLVISVLPITGAVVEARGPLPIVGIERFDKTAAPQFRDETIDLSGNRPSLIGDHGFRTGESQLLSEKPHGLAESPR